MGAHQYAMFACVAFFPNSCLKDRIHKILDNMGPLLSSLQLTLILMLWLGCCQIVAQQLPPFHDTSIKS